MKEVQEGDPKYLAPEVLHGSNNITCAADVFSLGMTILELATDLDLPRGGDAWHQLRHGQIPTHLTSSLSDDLIKIIMKMIEPDHVRRACVNELLDMEIVQQFLDQKYADRSEILIDHHNSSYYKKRLTSLNQEKNEHHNEDNTSNNSDDQQQTTQTSTPKKDDSFNHIVQFSMLHGDDDDRKILCIY